MSCIGKRIYFSVASSALSPAERRTGVVCVWKPVMVLGLPAWPTTSTAWPTRTGTGKAFRFSSTVINILGCQWQNRGSKNIGSLKKRNKYHRSNNQFFFLLGGEGRNNQIYKRDLIPAWLKQGSIECSGIFRGWQLSYQDMHVIKSLVQPAQYYRQDANKKLEYFTKLEQLSTSERAKGE